MQKYQFHTSRYNSKKYEISKLHKSFASPDGILETFEIYCCNRRNAQRPIAVYKNSYSIVVVGLTSCPYVERSRNFGMMENLLEMDAALKVSSDLGRELICDGPELTKAQGAIFLPRTSKVQVIYTSDPASCALIPLNVMQPALVSVRVGDAEFLQRVSAGLGHSWPLRCYQMCQIDHTLAAPSKHTTSTN